MVYYEIKKVFSKLSGKMALVFLCAALIWIGHSAINEVAFTSENGMEEYGRSAALKLKEAKQEWEGPLTEEKLAQAIRDNAKVNASEEANSNDIKELNIAYARTQGFGDIRELLNCSFVGFEEYDYYKVDSLKPSDAKKFYHNRETKLEEWLYEGKGAARFTEPEKQFLLSQYKALDTPLAYACADGWEKLFYRFPFLALATVVAIGFLLCGVFPCESQLKTDAVFYSSYHGRRKAVLAKLKAGLIIASVLYWLMALLYTAIVLGTLGSGGANCMIQSTVEGWLSFYDITIGQEYFLIVLGGYIGCLFFSTLVMFVSAKMKTAVLSSAIPLILILLPNYIRDIGGPFIEKLLGLLPDQLVSMNLAVLEFNLYSIGDRIVGAIPILLALYLALSLVLCPILYRSYRKLEVK